MVLAAGRGTRLAPLTDERPKPLLPLGPLPLLHFPLLLLRAAGIREVMVNLHHLGSQIRDQIGDGKNLDLSIRYSEEHPTLLGTGGGIKRARAFLEGGTFVVMNGDTLVDADLPRVLEAHARSGATATMVLADALPGEPFGLVAVDAEMRIRELAGRLGWKGRAHRTGHFCGIHVIESRVFESQRANRSWAAFSRAPSPTSARPSATWEQPRRCSTDASPPPPWRARRGGGPRMRPGERRNSGSRGRPGSIRAPGSRGPSTSARTPAWKRAPPSAPTRSWAPGAGWEKAAG
jgi:choline kinase